MVSGTNDKYLQKDVALREVYKIAEPNLVWGQFVDHIPETTNSFFYSYDSTGMSGDSKKETPPRHVGGAKFAELDYSRPSYTAGLTESDGFSMRIPRDVIRNEQRGRSEIMKAYNVAGFWLAEWINTATHTAVRAGGTGASSGSTAVWSGATATPVKDCINFASDMDREGYPYRATDMFVNKTGWYELKQYLTSIDVREPKQRALYGIPEITKDNIYIPVADLNIHKVMSGTTDGYWMILDNNNISAETHYYNDPKFTTASTTYNTIVDSKRVTKNTANLGIHFKQFEEDDTHDTVMQFWVEQKTVVTQAYGILTGTDI